MVILPRHVLIMKNSNKHPSPRCRFEVFIQNTIRCETFFFNSFLQFLRSLISHLIYSQVNSLCRRTTPSLTPPPPPHTHTPRFIVVHAAGVYLSSYILSTSSNNEPFRTFGGFQSELSSLFDFHLLSFSYPVS